MMTKSKKSIAATAIDANKTLAYHFCAFVMTMVMWSLNCPLETALFTAVTVMGLGVYQDEKANWILPTQKDANFFWVIGTLTIIVSSVAAYWWVKVHPESFFIGWGIQFCVLVRQAYKANKALKELKARHEAWSTV